MKFTKKIKCSLMALLSLAMLLCVAVFSFSFTGKTAFAEETADITIFKVSEHTTKDCIPGSGWWFHSDVADTSGSKLFYLNKEVVGKFVEKGYTTVEFLFNGGSAFGIRDYSDEKHYDYEIPSYSYISIYGNEISDDTVLQYAFAADYRDTPLSVSLTKDGIDYINKDIICSVSNFNNEPDYNEGLSQDFFVTSVTFKGAGKATYTFTGDNLQNKGYLYANRGTSTVTYLEGKGWRIDSSDGAGAYDDHSKSKSFAINAETIAYYYSLGYNKITVAINDGGRFGYDPNYVATHMNNLVRYDIAGVNKYYNQGISLPTENTAGFGTNYLAEVILEESLIGSNLTLEISNLYAGTNDDNGIFSSFVSYIKFSGENKDDVILSDESIKTKLESPKNLDYAENKFTWDAVEGAKSYEVELDGVTATVFTNEFVAESFSSFKVVAISDIGLFFNSDCAGKFLVKFVNEDEVIQSEILDYGVVPTYDGETPSKEADAQYTYMFSGWDVTPVAVTGTVTYTATYSTTTNKYVVIFKNYDGTELQNTEVEYRTIPTYDGETPTKEADAQYTYTFSGWDVTPVAVTGSATYTATYTQTKNGSGCSGNIENNYLVLCGILGLACSILFISKKRRTNDK